MPATAKFLHAVAGLPHGAVVLPGLDTDLDDELWQTIGGVRNAQGKFTTPPASNHPQFAMHALLDRFGLRPRRCRNFGPPGAARTRRAGVGDDAAFDRDGAMARPIGAARHRRKDFRRHEGPRRHRGAQPGDGGAGDRGGDAGGAASQQIRGIGHARPRTGPSRDGIADPLESRIRRFRRRCADGHTGRRVRPPHGGGRGKRAGAADAAGATETSAVQARRSPGLAEARDRSIGTGAAARHPAASRKRRACARLRALPQRARQVAASGSLITACAGAADAASRSRTRSGTGADHAIAESAGAAGKSFVLQTLRLCRTGAAPSRSSRRIVVRPARHCHCLRGTRGIGTGLRVRRSARQ